MAALFADSEEPTEAINAVTHVPMFAPIIMGIAEFKSIIFCRLIAITSPVVAEEL